MMKFLKGWRTVILNGVVVVVAVLDYLGTVDLKSVLPPDHAWVPIAIGAVNIALRTITNTQVGKAS